jgi:hypothetical protein
MIPEQISHPTERKLHCCNNHSNEQPIQSEYHRDSAASDKDRSQTKKSPTDGYVATTISHLLIRTMTDRCPGNNQTDSIRRSCQLSRCPRRVPRNPKVSRKLEGYSGASLEETEASHCPDSKHSPTTNDDQPHSRRNRAKRHPEPVNGGDKAVDTKMNTES